MNSSQPSHITNENDIVHPDPSTKESVGWRFLIASSLVGLTAGLFAGMSESPVATALIGGVFGLLGGGGILGLLVGGNKKEPAEAKATWQRPIQDFQPAAVATSLLCVFCIVGVFLGIGFREGWLLPRFANVNSSELIEISDAAKGLGRPLQMKLVVLQSELDTLGISPRQNNQFVSSYIAAIRETDPNSLGENSIEGMQRDAAYGIKAIEHALATLSQDTENPDEDDASKLLLKPYQGLTYGNVKEAYEYLKKASELAHSTENHILGSITPELSQTLDLLSKYRKSNLYQPAGRYASALVKPKKYRDSDPNNQLFIKP
jgi:hypothetical protein